MLFDRLIVERMYRSFRRVEAERLYGFAVDRAREPFHYAELNVPDTVEGRFEMIVIYVHLLCRRLIAAGRQNGQMAQKIVDTMFDDMDRNLREMGVGDLSVGKRIKRMAEDYSGRAQAMEAGLQARSHDQVLSGALARNVYGGGEDEVRDAPRLAGTVRAAQGWLESLDMPTLRASDDANSLFGPTGAGPTSAGPA